MATTLNPQSTIGAVNKPNAGKVIELLLKTAAGTYHRELSAGVPSVATKVNLRNYTNEDDNIRRKYYTDQIYHMVNEVYRDAIETDTVFAGKLERRLSIEYNKAGLINFHVYQMDESIADTYAYIIAMLVTMKSTWFMKKVMDQPLFKSAGMTNDAGDASYTTANLPFLGPITKDQYTNFAASSRRGLRNSSTNSIFTESIYTKLLGIPMLSTGTHINDGQFLTDEWIDLPAIKARAYQASTFYGLSGNLESVARRLMFVQLMFLRLMNSIDHSGNIFAGYQRRLDLCNFTRMLSSDALMLPIYDSMMMSYNYAIHSNNALATQAGTFDIAERKPFLEDIYGWSDTFGNPFMTPNNNSEWDASIIKLGVPFTDTTTIAKEGKLRELAGYLQSNISGLESRQSESIFQDLMKSSVGAMEDKWYLHHRVLGKDYFRYPELPAAASNKATKTRPFQDQYNPNIFKPSVMMYIAGSDVETAIATRQNQEVTLEQMMNHEERAITNYHPSNIISKLMNCRDPQEVFGFRVNPIPTDQDVRNISNWLRTNSKVVFVINDPNQAGLRTAVKTMNGEMGYGGDATKLMESYKAAMASTVHGARAAAGCKYIMDRVKLTLHPFKTINLTKALLASKFKNLQTHCNEALTREGGHNGRG